MNVDPKSEFDENGFGDDIEEDEFDVHFHNNTSALGIGISDLNTLLVGEDDDINLDSTFGNEWYNDRNFPSSLNGSSSNMHLRKNSLLVGDIKDWANLNDGVISQTSNVFENDVDLSMYEHVAANLQKTNPKLSKVSSYY